MHNFTGKVIRFILLVSAFCALGLIDSVAQSAKPNVCLVLSGGGARGAAHIGVLKALEREHIPIDCIVGTSFGALTGGLYSLGYSAPEIEKFLLSQDWNAIFSDSPQQRFMPALERRNARYQVQFSFRGWNPDLPTGLWEGQRMTELLDLLTTSPILDAQYDFDRLPIQFRAVATNLLDGKAFVFKQGRMTEAIRSSMAIPLVFTPVEKDGMLLVDGGIADNLPIDVALSLGAETIIAVDISSPLLQKSQILNFINVIDQAISLQMVKKTEANRGLANLLLQPDLQKFTSNDYHKIPEIIAHGEQEANRRMGEIKSLVSGIPPQIPRIRATNDTRIIESISLEGLKQLKFSQLGKLARLRVRAGDTLDLSVLVGDLGRLYATRLFESVDYRLDSLGDNKYRLTFLVKESSTKTLGLGLRYDNDYDFIALAEFTARPLFGGPSSATLASQFGGVEEHFASLHLIAPFAPCLFLEPRIELRQQQRQDIRNQKLVNTFSDRRAGARLIAGGSLFHILEVEGGYHSERVKIQGGSELNPSTVSPAVLAGLTFNLYRDSLDRRDFPQAGAKTQVLIEKQSTGLGSDFDYSKWQIDYQRYFQLSHKSTVQLNAGAGFSRGAVPYYDLFFIGGNSNAERTSRQFLGLDRDEIRANQVILLGASYTRQIFSNALGIVKQGRLVGTYNRLWHSARRKTPYRFDTLDGAGLGLALDTMVGPVRAMTGFAEGGRIHFYISIGPRF